MRDDERAHSVGLGRRCRPQHPVSVPVCLLVLTLAPGVTDERIGARHRAELLAKL